MRRMGGLVLVAALAVGGLSACNGNGKEGGGPGGGGGSAAPYDGTDWSPQAATVDGLSVTAQADADGFKLHTASGDKTFLPGVNLGSTTPLHQPGEVGDISRQQYDTWLDQIGSLGIRVVRIYTLLPPAFYQSLLAYDRTHVQDPIYLFQGAYLPDESYVEPGRTLYDKPVDDAFSQEIQDISDAVHGDLVRPPTPGASSGTYDADVSRWLAGWVIGVEWDPASVHRTDVLEADAPYTPGKYFAATKDASATERWLAGHMDALAASEAERGTSEPIAFINWPTDDPLTHPEEHDRLEDLASIDALHVLPTKAWPAGTFASFHLYPYYPDFQHYATAYEKTQYDGRSDPYAGYVAALEDHYRGTMPLLVTEVGVPGSLGVAHTGPLGRDQGGHSEQEEMALDAQMMQLLHDQGAAGAFLFIWEDEWFKRTWNTETHTLPERRQLWHDPLTNEQWFGLVATDPKPIPDAAVDLSPTSGPYKYLYVWGDASWVHFEVTFNDALPDRLTIDADVLKQLAGPDYRIDVDHAAGKAQVYVRKELDPIRLDALQKPYRPGADKPWHTYSLLTSQAYRVPSTGERHPQEYANVGDLQQGDWDPTSSAYDSMSTWQTDDARKTIQLRIPWSMLGMADPSSHTALGPGIPAQMVKTDGINLAFDADGERQDLDFSWPDWNNTDYTARLKAGIGVLEKVYRDLAP